MANSVTHENKRQTETVVVGAVKSDGTAVGTASGEFEGTVETGNLSQLTGVTSFTGIVVGTALSDSATGKVLAAGTTVEAFDSTAKTINLSKAASEAHAKEKVTFTNVYGAATAETKTIELVGGYAQADYLNIEQNIVEVVEKPKLKVQVEDSIDGGKTYFATEGVSALTEIVEAAGKSIARIDLSKKPFGPKLRLSFAFGAKGYVAGTYTILTGHA